MNTAKNLFDQNNQIYPNIIPIWQPVGYSTYKITMDIARKLGIKTAQTGVLDPLAEGVIIVLAGDERFNKIAYAGWKKTYEFTLSLGLSTDSYDGMGLVTAQDFSKVPDISQVKEVLASLVGKYEQRVPLYSAKKLNGKRLFEYPKRGLTVDELPTKSGEIYLLELLEASQIDLHDLIDQIISKINLVKHGEFRQKETVQGWEELKKQIIPQKVSQLRMRAELSRGLYVRSLSQDIANSLGTIGFVSELIRIKNGIYTKENSYSLEQIL